MATNVFQIPVINPFRFVNATAYDEIDPRYNTLPFDMKKDGDNPNGFYAQKWQINDFTAFQVDSDFNSVAFNIWNLEGNFLTSIYRNIAPSTPAIKVTGVSWVLYEFAVNFAGFPEGMYCGVLTYTDQNGDVQNIQTSPLDVRVKHYGTLLYEYYNTNNNKGIVWDTGIRMSFRIEGKIREYTPKTLTEDYIDQEYNAYLLNDIPYRTFVNYIGLARGLPDWAVDKMNVIYTANALMIDGTPYCKLPGQTFKMSRPTNGPNENGYASIEIIPNENFNLEAYKTGNTPNGAFKVVNKVLPYYNNAADIAVAGIFKVHTRLIGIGFWNKGANAFTLNVGITPGGREIGSYPITTDITFWQQIDKVFETPQTVYFSGLIGTDLDIDIEYSDWDAVQSDPSGGSGGLVPNIEYTYYEDVVGDFDRDWDVPTGMGNVGTDFENCVMLDGQNSTILDAYLFRMGWDKTTPLTRQSIQGASNNQLFLMRSMLPAVGLLMLTNDVNNTNDDTPTNVSGVARAASDGHPLSYELRRGATMPPAVGLSENMGAGDPVDITPECLVVVRFIYRKPVGP